MPNCSNFHSPPTCGHACPGCPRSHLICVVSVTSIVLGCIPHPRFKPLCLPATAEGMVRTFVPVRVLTTALIQYVLYSPEKVQSATVLIVKLPAKGMLLSDQHGITSCLPHAGTTDSLPALRACA